MQRNTQILEHLGYRATVRHSGEDALAVFSDDPARFDAVLTDHTMPGMSGIELSARLARLRPGLPVIMASGHGDAAIGKDARAAGICEVLVKPVTIEELGAAVRRALGTTASA